jgi:hypothetical protein
MKEGRCVYGVGKEGGREGGYVWFLCQSESVNVFVCACVCGVGGKVGTTRLRK